MFKIINKAFTLAEVILALTIIGIIAAMTIPSLINNIQDQDHKTRWKKIYTELDSAVKMAMINNGGDLLDFCNKTWPASDNCVKNELIKYLNVRTSCDSNGSGKNTCLYSSPKFKYLNGTTSTWTMNMDAGIVLNNGAMLSLYWDPDWGGYEGPFLGMTYGGITIDTNGSKGPNQFGKDIMRTHFTSTGVKPFGVKGDVYDIHRYDSHQGCDLNADPDAKGWTCAADYLMQ